MFELLSVYILHLVPSLCLEVQSPGVSVGSELLGWGLWLWEGIQTEFLACDSCESSVSTAGWKDREGQALPLPYPVEGRCCCMRGCWAGSCSYGSGHALNN